MLLAFGDSTTAGEVTVPTLLSTADGFPGFRRLVVPATSYPTQLLGLLRGRYTTQASSVTNAGLPGEWAADGAMRLPGVMLSVRPEVLLLLEGFNDPLQTSRGMRDAVAAIETMSREGHLHGARVFIASLTPGRSGGVNTIPASILTDFNSRVRSVASNQGDVFVDLYAPLLADVSTYIGIDGLHPNEAGYRRMAELFFEAIRADLEVR
jgi:lysophospholipase L1-like esterase